jgi:hypothetical protein
VKILLSGIILLFSFVILYSLPSCTKTTVTTVVKNDTVTVIDSSGNIRDGLVAYYNFNNGSISDSSGYNNNIVFNNATLTTDRFGNANNAYLFDGSSYMTVANSASINPQIGISLMAIIKINAFYPGNCGVNNILSKGSNDYVNGFYALRFTNFGACNNPIDSANELFYGAYGDNESGAGNDVIDSNSTVKEGQWYNIIYTYEAGIGKFYINGILVNTMSKPVSFTPNTSDLYIGKHGDPTYPYYFNGVIDEIRIYDRALSSGDIYQLNHLTK